ncbi:winged helix-turn-helix domain-containing protein [Pukyongiella litopenaei]|uniref:Winged helix-turn-helix domain-containing protein n=1 Tax=Pukyongiella litopenaei TaxID=2605946 RepID=A0A2S0MPN1_9RHOB|nr:crosslink repair DNA glycosylase YcaQ family protein [Pukyongiella litopenaei]AVO37797.1 winged helix-turn-helix domain-containing protein [Pukyongiella litopenaei]
MSHVQLDNPAARRLFLHRHALAEPPAGPGRGDDLAALIHRLGFVQLDSINTVGRAHDMILRARRPAFRPAHLGRLYERDRALFEHWTHDAAMIPIAFYPQWRLRFARDAEMLKARWRNWRRDGFEDRFAAVLAHIRDHGPVSSSEVGTDEKKGSGGWWDWHPSKTALEYLWRSGALAVVGRSGFQKRYDLSERVIDSAMLTGPGPEPQECVNWLCGAALDRLGFATPGEIAAFWDTATPAEARDWCHRQLAKDALIDARIACADGRVRRVFARPDIADQATAAPEPTGRLRVLSPFDPALRDRARAERLFGFHYRIEVFVPAAKRKYGYYVFPLLEGDRLVGRIDMKARRDGARLQVRALWPEPGIRWGRGRAARLEAELDRVARFAGLETVGFDDGWLRDPIPAAGTG